MQSQGNGYVAALTAAVNILRFNTTGFYDAANHGPTNRMPVLLAAGYRHFTTADSCALADNRDWRYRATGAPATGAPATASARRRDAATAAAAAPGSGAPVIG